MAVLCVFVLMAAPAMAQSPVPNPSRAEFTVSIDHSTIDSYELAMFDAADLQIATLDIGKPAPDATGTAGVPINVQPIKFGLYTARIRAKAGAVYSAWSDPSNLWVREPGKPSKVVIK
jgi:hypothetical protein